MTDKPSYRHVGASAYKRVGDRVDQDARNAKVTQFNLPLRVEKDVGGFDIYRLSAERPEEASTSMNNFVVIIKIYQAVKDLEK